MAADRTPLGGEPTSTGLVPKDLTAEPYYQDESVTIYHADSLRFIQKYGSVLEFNALLTDPPYGIDGGSGGDARDYGKGRYDGAWVDSPLYIERRVVPVIRNLLQRGTPAAITPGVPCFHLYPPPRDMGCFWAPAAITHGPWGFTTFSPILYYGKDWRAGRGILPSGAELTEVAEKNGHPCPKPIRAWSWLLDKVAPLGALVLDPYMGSGTTLRAAKDRGRKAIGIEIEERFCEIAALRMGQEVLDLAV